MIRWQIEHWDNDILLASLDFKPRSLDALTTLVLRNLIQNQRRLMQVWIGHSWILTEASVDIAGGQIVKVQICDAQSQASNA